MNDLEILFVSELKDIHDGERQLVSALGELEQSAASPELKSAFHEHREQTRGHVNRLERVFKEFGESPKRETCHGLDGIIDEVQAIVKEFQGNFSPLQRRLPTQQRNQEGMLSGKRR